MIIYWPWAINIACSSTAVYVACGMRLGDFSRNAAAGAISHFQAGDIRTALLLSDSARGRTCVPVDVVFVYVRLCRYVYVSACGAPRDNSAGHQPAPVFLCARFHRNSRRDGVMR